MTKSDVCECARSVAGRTGKIINFILVVNLKDKKPYVTKHNNLILDSHVLIESKPEFEHEIEEVLGGFYEENAYMSLDNYL